MTIFFLFVVGLIVGSFLNAIIYRLSVHDSALRGRSYCPHCKHVLGFLDLIPLVSFLWLAGRCRYCHKKISWQYPAVELATALAFIALYWRTSVGSTGNMSGELQFIFAAVMVCFLVIIFVYDALHYLILDSVVIPAIILSFLANLYFGVSVTGMLLAAIVAGGFFALQFIVSRGRWIGGGDIRVGVLMGTLLGWPNVLVALFLAYCVGSVIAIGLLVSQTKHLQSKIPFGTFLTVATFITMLFGNDLLRWYLHFYL